MRISMTLAWLLALGACAPVAPPVPAPPDATLEARAMLIGQHMRAALACAVAVSMTARDRAAAIEAASLARRQQSGGAVARDAYLAALAQPVMDPQRAGRDRTAWCAARRPDIERIGAWLDSEQGAAFAAGVAAPSQP